MNNNLELLPHLRIFCMVVENRSFTSVANVLDSTTSQISRRVKWLETQLGVQLLNRTTRTVGTTDEGAALYQSCRSALDHLQSALLAVKQSRTEASGLLRITSSVAFGRRFVAPAVAVFRKRYPAVEVDLSLTDDIVDLVESGIDIAIRGGSPDDSRLIVRDLAPLPMYVCATPSYLATHGTPSTPAELADHMCIRYRFRSSRRIMDWEFASGDERFSIPVSGPLCIDDIESVCDAAIAGEGLAQLPGYIAVASIRSGALIPVLLDHLDVSRRFSLTYVNRSELQPLRDSLFVTEISSALSDKKPFALSNEEFCEWVKPQN